MPRVKPHNFGYLKNKGGFQTRPYKKSLSNQRPKLIRPPALRHHHSIPFRIVKLNLSHCWFGYRHASVLQALLDSGQIADLNTKVLHTALWPHLGLGQ
jgi:hypothetical protein